LLPKLEVDNSVVERVVAPRVTEKELRLFGDCAPNKWPLRAAQSDVCSFVPGCLGLGGLE